MKSYSYIIALLMAVILMAGCEKYETYSDMKKKEQDAIERFIEEQGIEVIDQTTFEAQGNTTILAKISLCALHVTAFTCRLYAKVAVIN